MKDAEIDIQFWDPKIDRQFWELANEFECLLTKTDVFEAIEAIEAKTKTGVLKEVLPEEVMQIEVYAEAPEQTTGDWKNELLGVREEKLSHASEKVVAEKVPQAHAEIKNEFRNARVRPPKEISQDDARRRLRAQMEARRWTREDYVDYYQNGPTRGMMSTRGWREPTAGLTREPRRVYPVDRQE